MAVRLNLAKEIKQFFKIRYETRLKVGRIPLFSQIHFRDTSNVI